MYLLYQPSIGESASCSDGRMSASNSSPVVMGKMDQVSRAYERIRPYVARKVQSTFAHTLNPYSPHPLDAPPPFFLQGPKRASRGGGPLVQAKMSIVGKYHVPGREHRTETK